MTPANDNARPYQERSKPVLLPYQVRWLRDQSRVKVMEKSRRIGATWATAAEAVLLASSGQSDVWYVCYNEESTKEFIRDAKRWVEWLGFAASEMGHTLASPGDPGGAFSIGFPSGKRITGLSSARSLRGKQGLVVIDEAAFHTDLPELLKAAFALLMWGGQVWILSTHNGADNAFAQLCDEIRDGKRTYSLHKVTITDALGEGLYQRICERLNQPYSLDLENEWLRELEHEYGDGVREELYCEPLRAGASYLGRDLIESCMVDAPVLRMAREESWMHGVSQADRTAEMLEWCELFLRPLLDTLPKHLPHALGWDFGRYADRTVLAPLTLSQNLVRRVPFLIELQGLPHHDQWTILKYVGDRLPSFFRACLDAGGNGAWIAEQAAIEWGPEIVDQVDISIRWYSENMPPFKEAHERGLIEYPRDIDVRNDLALIRRIDGVPRIPKLRIDSMTSSTKRHGDAAIALVMAYTASRDAEAENARWNALAPDNVLTGTADGGY